MLPVPLSITDPTLLLRKKWMCIWPTGGVAARKRHSRIWPVKHLLLVKMWGEGKIQSGSQPLGEFPEQHEAENPRFSGCKTSAVHLEMPWSRSPELCYCCFGSPNDEMNLLLSSSLHQWVPAAAFVKEMGIKHSRPLLRSHEISWALIKTIAEL